MILVSLELQPGCASAASFSFKQGKSLYAPGNCRRRFAISCLSFEEGKKSSNNNPFGMDNRFYLEHIEPKLQEYKNSDKNAKLFPSPEYEDLILMMKVLKEKGTKPLFVILPMNGRWSDYTGFSRTERQACYQRLAQMIQAEGFPLSDFTAHENDDYYLRDPWHLAWKGWVDVNEALEQFYKE